MASCINFWYMYCIIWSLHFLKVIHCGMVSCPLRYSHWLKYWIALMIRHNTWTRRAFYMAVVQRYVYFNSSYKLGLGVSCLSARDHIFFPTVWTWPYFVSNWVDVIIFGFQLSERDHIWCPSLSARDRIWFPTERTWPYLGSNWGNVTIFGFQLSERDRIWFPTEWTRPYLISYWVNVTVFGFQLSERNRI